MTTYQKRIFSFWGGIVIAYLLPLLILSFKYDLFKKYTASGTKWSFWVTLGILFLVIRLWSDLRTYIQDMNFGWIRAAILGVMSIAPWVLLGLTTFLIAYFADDYIFVVRTIAFCNMGAIPLWVIHEKYRMDYKVERGDVRVAK